MAIETTRRELGKQFSEGARLLWQEKAERGWTQGALMRAIGAKPGVVQRWLYGDTKPSWKWASKLEEAFGIPLKAWTLEPKVPFIAPAARDGDEGVEAPLAANN